MTATARLDGAGLAFEGEGAFIVDTFTSDGGGWRNVILEKGLDLVDFGFMTLRQFVSKACELPARVLSLPEKGHLGVGADADVIVVDRAARKVELTVANGKVVQIDGVVVGNGATVLTTSDGAKQVAAQGLTTRVVDVTQGYLYTKGREQAA
jgi:predicted amidohydrolase